MIELNEIDTTNLTLNEAMHLALDGAKVCHDEQPHIYIYWDVDKQEFWLQFIKHTEKHRYPSASNFTKLKSGWKIYEDPI